MQLYGAKEQEERVVELSEEENVNKMLKMKMLLPFWGNCGIIHFVRECTKIYHTHLTGNLPVPGSYLELRGAE